MKLRNYDGVSVIRLGRAPTSGDYGRIPTLWIDETNKNAYMLVHVADDGTTQWDKFASVTYVDNTVATVSGNINSFLEMTDTPDSYSTNSLIYVTSSGVEYTSPDITWDGSALTVTGSLFIEDDEAALFQSYNSFIAVNGTHIEANGDWFKGSNQIYTVNNQGSEIGVTGVYMKAQTERTVSSGIYDLKGIHVFVDHNAESDVRDIMGIDILSSSNFENGNLDSAIGLRSRVVSCGKNWEDSGWADLGNPVLVPKAYGITSQVRYRFGGKIDVGYGVYIYTPENVYGGGDYINTAYGLYVEDHSTSATAVNNDSHAIYVEGGKSYFGGDVTTSGNLIVTTTSGYRTSGYSESSVVIHRTGVSNGLKPYLLDLDMDVQPLGDTTSMYGIGLGIATQRNLGNDLTSLWGQTFSIDHDGDGNVDSELSCRFRTSSNGKGDVSDLTGIRLETWSDGYNHDEAALIDVPGLVDNLYGITIQNGARLHGNVNNMYGIMIYESDFTEVYGEEYTGSVNGDHYGIYIENTPSTNISGSNYAIYVEGGKSYFGGNVTVSGVINTPSNPPSTASGVGTEGDLAWDADYIYVCVADNTWKRSSLSSW